MADSTANAKSARIFYARVDEFARKEEKYRYLDDAGSLNGVEWHELEPDAKHTWLTEGMRDEFESFLPMGTKAAKASKSVDAESIFKIYSYGVLTARDAWAYDFSEEKLRQKIERLIDYYRADLARWERKGAPQTPQEFLLSSNPQIKWTRRLFKAIRNHLLIQFELSSLRNGIYRPFTKRHLYFSKDLNEEVYALPSFLPTKSKEDENRLIWLKTGTEVPIFALMVNVIPDALPQGGSQCFPFYTYNEDGTNRRENITDWALAQFRRQYKDKSISKLDIFHYVYALLHHPTYRTTYAANLKRELPRIPFVKSPQDFRAFVRAGERLADLHVNYEAQPEYRLERIETEDAALDWRVERMRLSKDKSSIVYNDFLTLEGIPPKAFEYRLGNRSALEWIIDQYQVSTDKRSGITNDPNRADEPDYIVKLIGKVTTVSVETVKIIRALPDFQII